jgi:hypothetical protein
MKTVWPAYFMLSLLHVVEDGADDSADYAAFDGLPGGLVRQITFDAVRQSGDG